MIITSTFCLIGGVLEVTSSGGVIGVPPGRKKTVAPKKASGAWNEKWPKRHRLISLLNCDDDDESLKFKDMQQYLKEELQVHAHWFCLHALWRLIEEGLVEKRPDGYRLTKLGKIQYQADQKRDRDAITEALKRVGKPYASAKFIEELRAIPGHNNLDDGIECFDDSSLKHYIESRIKTGELMA